MDRDWWLKGGGFDLWSIPHFLFGVLMGMLPLLTGVSFVMGCVFTAFLAVSWEVFEKSILRVRETTQNVILDVVLALLGYALVAHLLFLYPLHRQDAWMTFIAIGVLYLFMNLSGWLAYRRRQRDLMP